jgi:hypothetical protein
MPIYWKQSASGVQMKNSNAEEENKSSEMQKPQMQNIEDEEQMENLVVNTVLIFNLQITNKSMNNNYKVKDLGCKNLKMICHGY